MPLHPNYADGPNGRPALAKAAKAGFYTLFGVAAATGAAATAVHESQPDGDFTFVATCVAVISMLLGVVLLFVYSAAQPRPTLDEAIAHFEGRAQDAADRLTDLRRHRAVPVAALPGPRSPQADLPTASAVSRV